ncbi:winged helix-turn-helix transcriptional regulator [Pedobacter terrae]|nr:winged helix-turn-helix transcriptional regulator [Pedobacter terrae]
MGNKDQIHSQCRQTSIAINDALDLLAGKWTPLIIMALLVRKVLCFTALKTEIEGISSKVLSSSLKRLEQQLIIERNASSGQLGKIEYKLTDHGRNLEKLLEQLSDVGIAHRIMLTGRNVQERAIAEFENFGTKHIL